MRRCIIKNLKRCDQMLLNVTRHSAGEDIPAHDLSTAIAFAQEMCMPPPPS
jgi:hypothetical protein